MAWPLTGPCGGTISDSGGINGGWTGSQVTGGYGPGSGAGCRIEACGTHCSFDYDAVGTYQTTVSSTINGQSFSLVEPHGKKIDSTAFANFKFPAPPAPEPNFFYAPQDLRPSASCALVVDQALLIPNINDNFLGAGPDIGAYEAGQQLPIYGPRLAGVDEQTPYDGGGIVPCSMEKGSSEKNIRINVYPNAFGPAVCFYVPSMRGSTAMLEVYTVAGEKLWSSGMTDKGEISFRPSGEHARIQSGVYCVSLRQDQKKIARKFAFIR